MSLWKESKAKILAGGVVKPEDISTGVIQIETIASGAKLPVSTGGGIISGGDTPPTPVTPKYTFAINPTPADAVVTINGQIRSTITAEENTAVEWSVEAEGYTSQSGSLILTENKTLDVALVAVPTEWVQTTDWRNDGITDISISNYNTNRTVRLKGSLDSIYAVGVTEDHSLSNYVTIDTCDEYKSVECGYVTLKFSSGIRVKSVDLYMDAHDTYYYQGIGVMFRDKTGGSGTSLYKKSLDWYTYENNTSNETTAIEISLQGHHNYKATYLYGIRLHAEYV